MIRTADDNKVRGGAHRKPSGNIWKHTTFRLKPSVWDRLKKSSAIEIDNCSRWAIKKISEYEGIPPATTVGENDKTILCPFCFTLDELLMLKQKADDAGMNKTKYFTNVMMDVIDRGL